MSFHMRFKKIPRPVKLTDPVISGTVQRGQTLTATSGTYSGNNINIIRQWFRNNDAIVGATSLTYVLVEADVNSTIKYIEFVSNPGGNISATSNILGPVLNLAPVNTVIPEITGTTTQGQVLSVSNGTWDYNPSSYTYQWKRATVNITNATQSNYTLQADDVGNTITCTVTAINNGGSNSATSLETSVISALELPAPVNTAPPVVAGTVYDSGLLTCSSGTWSNTPTSYAYQWLADGTNISGATSSTYDKSAADQDKIFSCRVIATNANGSAAQISSNTIGPIVAAPENILTIQSTDSYWLEDYAYNLISDNPDNSVLVTNNSTALTFHIANRWESIGPGSTGTYYKNELEDPFCWIESTGASVGDTGYIQFSYKNGANETGTLVHKYLNFEVSEDPWLTYVLGKRTRPGYGGFPVHTLPGTLADKRISAQSNANALAVWTDETALGNVTANDTPIIPTGAATKAWITWNGTYGSTTITQRTVGANPTVGDNAYWMDITDVTLSRTWRINFTVDPQVHNVRPALGRGDGSQFKGPLSTALSATYYTFRAADKCISEAGEYPTTSGPYMKDAIIGENGEVPPTSPYITGWEPLPNRARLIHPNFRVLKSRIPFATSFASSITFSSRDATGPGDRRPHYLRVCGFDKKENIAFGNGFTPKWGWIVMDHCRGGRISLTAGDAAEAIFFLDNKWNANINLYGRDCQIVGNTFDGCAGNDAIAFCIYDTAGYSERTSWISWNLIKNQSTLGGHGDFIQNRPYSNAPLISTYYPAGTDIPMPIVIGNIFYMGICVPQSDGLIYVAQGYFMSEEKNGYNAKFIECGNFYCGIASNGLALKKPGPTSKVRNNTLVQYLLSLPTQGGGAPKIITFDSSSGDPYYSCDLQANAAHTITKEAVIPAYSTPNWPNVAGNINDYVTNPYVEMTDLSIGQIIANYQPNDVHGGLKYDSGGVLRERIVGCFGDLDLIDHRRQTYNEAVMLA